MREIKFRAWDLKRNEMLPITLMDWNTWWVSCEPILDTETKPLDYGERNSFQNEATDRHILMQYTGFKDANGKEIYESDIVENTNGQTFKVVWEKLGWAIENESNFFSGWVPERTEIVGNIYESPHLVAL